MPPPGLHGAVGWLTRCGGAGVWGGAGEREWGGGGGETVVSGDEGWGARDDTCVGVTRGVGERKDKRWGWTMMAAMVGGRVVVVVGPPVLSPTRVSLRIRQLARMPYRPWPMWTTQPRQPAITVGN